MLISIALSSQAPTQSTSWSTAMSSPVGSVALSGSRVQECAVEHIELGYASIVHRSQGMTCDKTIALVDESWNRELFYVGVTRARTGTELVVLSKDTGDEHYQHRTDSNDGTYSADDVLSAILSKSERQIAALSTYAEIQQETLDKRGEQTGQQHDAKERSSVNLQEGDITPDTSDDGDGTNKLAFMRARQFAEIEQLKERSRERGFFDRGR